MPQTNITTGQQIGQQMNQQPQVNNNGGIWGAIGGLGQAVGSGLTSLGNTVTNWFTPSNQNLSTWQTVRDSVEQPLQDTPVIDPRYNDLNYFYNGQWNGLNNQGQFTGTEAQQTVPYSATQYTNTEPQNWWDRQYGGMTLGQWGQLGMQGLGAINTYKNGKRMLDLAKDQLALQRDAYERNFNMEQTNYNQYREDLYRSRSMMERDKRLAENPDYLVELNGEQINNKGQRQGGSTVSDAQKAAVEERKRGY